MLYEGAFRRTSFARVVLGFAVLTFAVPASAGLIDDFEQGSLSVDIDPQSAADPYVNQTGLDPQHTLLGFRGAFLDAPTTGATTLQLEPADAREDALVMHVPAGQTGVLGLAYLDALAGAASPRQGDLDLTSDGANAFAITLTAAPASFTLDAFLSTDPLGEHRGSIVITGSGPGTYYLEFDDVRPYAGETAPDFTDVDYLSFHAVARADSAPATLAISEIRTAAVPEPACAGAALVAAAALAARSPRRSRRA